jgi:hypothetical protein
MNYVLMNTLGLPHPSTLKPSFPPGLLGTRLAALLLLLAIGDYPAFNWSAVR